MLSRRFNLLTNLVSVRALAAEACWGRHVCSRQRLQMVRFMGYEWM